MAAYKCLYFSQKRTTRSNHKFGEQLWDSPLNPGGGGYSIYPWVGRCDAAPHTLTQFKTNIADFPT